MRHYLILNSCVRWENMASFLFISKSSLKGASCRGAHIWRQTWELLESTFFFFFFGWLEGDFLTQDLNFKSAVGDMWLKTLKAGDLSPNVKCNSSKGLVGKVEKYHTVPSSFRKDPKWAVVLKWSCGFRTGATYLESCWKMPQGHVFIP